MSLYDLNGAVNVCSNVYCTRKCTAMDVMTDDKGPKGTPNRPLAANIIIQFLFATN